MPVALWDSGEWDADIWAPTTIAEALEMYPDIAHGVPVGLGDWRLSVEALLPYDPGALWGVGLWGTAEWSSVLWYDLTPWVRGLQWTRGSDEPYGRPRIGMLECTLDSTDDRWSPWYVGDTDGAGYFGPGTLVRVGLRSDTDTRAGGWLPQFCGILDRWGQTYVGPNGADRFVDFSANETLRDLSQIDENALVSAVGSGENPVERLERLLTAAEWKYGDLQVEAQHVLFSPGTYPLQSTDMSANRLAECYQAADACDADFRTDRKGRALLTNPEYIGNIGDADSEHLPQVDFSYQLVNTYEHPYWGVDWQNRTGTGATTVRFAGQRTEGFTSIVSDDSVVNDARFARVGGTQQTSEQVQSIATYGRRTLVRNDFPNTTDGPVGQIADYVTIRRGLNALRVENVTVDVVDSKRLNPADLLQDGAHVTNGALHLPGSSGDYASVPDEAALDITGDIEVVLRMSVGDASATGTIVSKGGAAWLLYWDGSTGKLTSYTNGAVFASSSALTFSDDQTVWLKWTRTTGGTHSFYWAEDQDAEPTSWTAAGTTAAAAAALGTTSTALDFGTNALSGFYKQQVLKECIIRDGIAGSIVFDLGVDAAANNAATFEAASGQTVTVHSTGSGPDTDAYGLLMAAVDVHTPCYVYSPDGVEPGTSGRPWIFAYLAGMTHRITPRNGGEVTWQADFRFDTRTVVSIPGAQITSELAS